MFSNTVWNESSYGINNGCRYEVIHFHTAVYADISEVQPASGVEAHTGLCSTVEKCCLERFSTKIKLDESE